MKLNYNRRSKLASALMQASLIGLFVLVGYGSTRSLFAASPETGINVYVDKPEYNLGDLITVTIANTTPIDAYVVNNCPAEPLNVYYLDNGAWTSVDDKASSSKCAGEPRTYAIPADRSIKVNYRYWPDVFSKPGKYRVAANIESYSTSPSVSFQVVK